MKICLVCPRTPREKFAGIENLVVQVAEALKRNGDDVTIFTTAKRPRDNVFSGIVVAEFPRFAPNDSYYFSPALVRTLGQGHFDLIHCFGYNNLVTLMILMSKKKGSKLAVTPASAGSSSFLRRILLLPFERVFSFFGQKIDMVIFLSEFERKLFSRFLVLEQGRTRVIPIGVDQNAFDAIPSDRTHEIVSIGRLVKNKGFDRLLRVFSIVAKTDPRIRLRIAGDGPERVSLERLADALKVRDKVVFEGHIAYSQRKRLFEMLKKAKAFVFLSKYESQGVVISEAVAAKTPAIVFCNSAQKEFVERGWAIGVNETDSDETIAKRIREVLKKPSLFAPKGIPPTIDETVQEHLGLYRELLGKGIQTRSIFSRTTS